MIFKKKDKSEKYGALVSGDDNRVPLEKGDLPAIIISAFIVFLPVILILGVFLVLAWFFIH